jgi:hypothetical protein
MTPKEKAEELTNKFLLSTPITCDITDAKKCAIIAVDEILKAPFENSYIDLISDEAEDTDWFWDKFIEYWTQVKQEILTL